MEKQFEVLQALETNGEEHRNKIFNDLIKERTKEIAELEGKIDYNSVMFVTTTERRYHFNKYRTPSILFHETTKEKIKLSRSSKICKVNLNMNYQI